MPSIIAYNGNGSDDGTVPPDLNTSYNPGAKGFHPASRLDEQGVSR